MSGTRRALLGGMVALAATHPARAQLQGSARLLVPGPEDGALALWAQRLAGQLGRAVAAAGAALRLDAEVLGGPDGVTAANRFATAAHPDGRTLLLLPGAACQARLVGETRARFDPAGWLPVCAAETPVILAARGPLPAGPGTAPPLRLALAAPDHPSAAALLALDLLGIAAQPVLGIPPEQAEAALAQGAADALVLRGRDAPARATALGLLPWFALRQAAAPEAAPVPSLAALAPPLAPRTLLGAVESAGAAAHLAAAVLLPALTPADMVALWRGAALRWVEEETRAAGGQAASASPLPGPDAAALVAAIAPPADVMQAYRDWLRQRLGWRAG